MNKNGPSYRKILLLLNIDCRTIKIMQIEKMIKEISKEKYIKYKIKMLLELRLYKILWGLERRILIFL